MLIESLRTWAERTPDAPALIGRGYTLSYGELLDGARAGAAWLHACGARAGETVALSLEPKPDLTERQACLVYAAACLGAALLPIYPGVPAALRGTLATRFNARWLIETGTSGEAPGCTRIDPHDFDPWSSEWRGRPAPSGGDPARPLHYEFTSGTTGTPKVVLFTGAQYAAIVRNNFTHLRWVEGDRVLPVVRFPGKVGLRSLVRAHAAGGALVNVQYPETREQLAEVIENLGVTVVRSTPWQLRQLLASELPAGLRARLPRSLEVAGAIVAPQEIRAARAALTADVHLNYATSEGGMIAHLAPEDAPDAGPRLIAGMEGQAVDDAGHPLPAGAVGRLRFRAAWLPTAYVANEEATAKQFAEGWFYPGDSGSIDAAGRVTLSGRTDDAINYGGTKLMPRDIERVLEQHPDVAEAALVGISDPLKGELPVAFVVLRRDVPGQALHAFYAARLDASWLPAAVLAVREIPRNPEGKVLRERLREIFLESARRAGT